MCLLLRVVGNGWLDDAKEDVELEDECVLIGLPGSEGVFPANGFGGAPVALEGRRRAIFSIDDLLFL